MLSKSFSMDRWRSSQYYAAFYSLLSRAFGIPFVLPVEFGIPRLAERELTQ